MFWDVLSTFVNVVAETQTSSAAVKAASYNQSIKRFNSGESLRIGKIEEDKVRRDARRQIGLMRANVGASGFDLSGSAMDVLYESTANAEIDAMNTRNAYRAQAQSYNMEADLYGQEARDAKRSGTISAAKQLLRGATTIWADNADQSSGSPFKLGRV